MNIDFLGIIINIVLLLVSVIGFIISMLVSSKGEEVCLEDIQEDSVNLHFRNKCESCGASLNKHGHCDFCGTIYK